VNPALRNSAAHVFVASLDAPKPEPDDEHHLFRVLRLREREAVTVSDGRGSWIACEVRNGALLPVSDAVLEPSPPTFTVASAVPKGDRCDWMVQKLTEIGVSDIVFLHCARSVVRWEGDRAAKQLARMQRIAKEAAVQSRRVWLPTLRGPVSFTEAVAAPGAVLAEPDGDPAVTGTYVVIGPEGGFSPEELSAPVPHLRLSDTVLRVETAAVVAAARFLTVREEVQRTVRPSHRAL
jgi:16S rRNA (uracil1498-N3)-methyltransferase